MQPYRSKGLAFFLNFIPGMGHYYVGKKTKAIIYALLFFGALGLGFMAGIVTRDDAPFVSMVIFAFIIGCINMLDMIIYLIRTPYIPNTTGTYGEQFLHAAGLQGPNPMQANMPKQENERFFTILLSFVPGLGHFYLGLMQRGLSFLIAFFGLSTVLIFLTAITHQSGFAVFLGLLPIIWLYCMFDAVKFAHQKQRGEMLVDRTLFDDFENYREEGKRSKMLAMMLSVLPGAGHMYLGLQKRGLQLMVAFLGSIYILDFLRLSLFLFLIPLIWCFSFFDALQQISRYGREELRDIPIVKWIGNHQRWLGVILVLLGSYYILIRLIVPILEVQFPDWLGQYRYRIEDYFQTIVIAVLFIGGGIKLLTGSKQRNHREVGEPFHGSEYSTTDKRD
ncbi:hypothetical protein BVG16_04945 [Paenibacillus selenitireducens]|uniref:Multi-tm2 domain protein n=1 Tax=Paenibacillus selenitireducens TaxID=1324314 RepID=A0A1T2XJP2_9BACL|nr:hypothetical protein [Paenibacillus selenitireducens]OPA80100.1 hypothetical protein BVG16_04945 [Paenibacillus selenitireducens]